MNKSPTNTITYNIILTDVGTLESFMENIILNPPPLVFYLVYPIDDKNGGWQQGINFGNSLIR